LFVFLSMAGKDGVFANVQGWVFFVIAVVGILVCAGWFEHMRSFEKIYKAMFGTLESLERDLGTGRPLRPFTLTTAALRKDGVEPTQPPAKWRYRPVALVDRVAPVASSLLFIALLLFKILK